MAGGASDDDEPITAINVTPLVDVVLVLLIIFMVTTEVIHRKDKPKVMPVELPSAASAQELLSKGMLSLVLLPSGEMLLNDAVTTFAALGNTVDGLFAKGVKPQALISADTRVTYGRVAELMDFLRVRKVTDIAFNTKKQEIE